MTRDATTDQAAPASRWSMAAIGPLLVVVGVALGTLWWALSDSDDRPIEPVPIEATGPRFATFDDLVAASDLVVLGRVIDIDEGRAITDPAQPAAGIRTQLAAVEIDEVFVGEIRGPLVVEQEAELLDGTPVRVNGVDALELGDTGYLFLIRGDSDAFPYTALVNEQGWVPVVDGLLDPVDAIDTTWTALAGRSSDELARLFR